MFIVVHTQHRENYGAHDWDGQGECPQYWKFKGGDTYILRGVGIEDVMPDGKAYDLLEQAIQSQSESFEEYIISMNLIDNCDFNVTDHVEDWESPIFLDMVGGALQATRTEDNDMMFRKEIRRKFETWTQIAGNREEYKCSYEFVNGKILPYKEACDYLAHLEEAA